MTNCVQPTSFYKKMLPSSETVKIPLLKWMLKPHTQTTHLLSSFDFFGNFFSIDDDQSMRATSNTCKK